MWQSGRTPLPRLGDDHRNCSEGESQKPFACLAVLLRVGN